MVKEIITYPTQMSLEYGIDVRTFDEKLFALLEDLKDTIKANNLDGLAAYQIGDYHNVIVVKDDNGEFIELINPRIIKHSDKTVEEETTAYFPGLSAKVARYNEISLVYQDRNGQDCSLQAKGKLARVIQRKVDYTFGGNFLIKLSPEEKDLFEKKLSSGIDNAIAQECPTTFVRDKFKKVSDIIKILMVLILIVSFFVPDETKATLWNTQLFASMGVVGFDIAYFLYGMYEARIYKHCTSCQIGNFIGTVAISFIKLSLLIILSYFIM